MDKITVANGNRLDVRACNSTVCIPHFFPNFILQKVYIVEVWHEKGKCLQNAVKFVSGLPHKRMYSSLVVRLQVLRWSK